MTRSGFIETLEQERLSSVACMIAVFSTELNTLPDSLPLFDKHGSKPSGEHRTNR
jgi:hypothetical protein